MTLGITSQKTRSEGATMSVETSAATPPGQFGKAPASFHETREDVMTTAMLVPTRVVPSIRWGSATKRSSTFALPRPFSSQWSSLIQLMETSAVSVPEKKADMMNPRAMSRMTGTVY